MILVNSELVELESATPSIVKAEHLNGEVEWRVGGATDVYVLAPVGRFLPGQSVELAYHDAVPVKAMVTSVEGGFAWGERERLHLESPPLRRPPT